MTTKFTPAPWVIYGDWGIKDSSGRLIAQYEPLCSDIDLGNTDESFANAHLIAAAPELYEALKKAIDLLASAEIQESVRVRGMTKIIRDGDKALKKARGES